MLKYKRELITFANGVVISDNFAGEDGKIIYGQTTTIENNQVDSDWIYECGVFAKNITRPREIYVPDYEFV